MVVSRVRRVADEAKVDPDRVLLAWVHRARDFTKDGNQRLGCGRPIATRKTPIADSLS